MSTINAQNHSGYYQLSNSFAGNSGTNHTTSTTDLLLSALNGPNVANTSTNNGAYVLSLSAQAQSYLSGASSYNPTGNSAFSLSTKQQQAVTDILTRFKDAPYTQNTFNAIQDDLKSAGLGSDVLKLEDQAKNFNTTGILISYLSGNTPASQTSVDSSTENTKANNYIQSVIKQWQAISTTYKSASTDAVAATGSAGGA